TYNEVADQYRAEERHPDQSRPAQHTLHWPFLTLLLSPSELANAQCFAQVVDHDGERNQKAQLRPDGHTDPDAQSFDDLLHARAAGKNGYLISLGRMSPVEASNGQPLIGLSTNEHAAMDGEIQPIDGCKPGEEARYSRRQRAELKGGRQHLKADRSQENAACETEGQRHDERRRPLPERKQTCNRRSQRCCQSNKYQDSSHRHCEGRTCRRLRRMARTARVLSHYRRSDRGRLNIPETNDSAYRFEGRPSRLSSYSRLGPLESSAARLRGCFNRWGCRWLAC